MNWYGSGFITVIIYGAFSGAIEEDHAILTENNFELLTEDGKPILIES